MSSKIIPLSLILIILEVSNANAQLSNNPWLKPNSKETIAKLYGRQSNYENNLIKEYTPEEVELVLPPPPQRTSSSNNPSKNQHQENTQKSEGFAQKIKNLLASKPEKETTYAASLPTDTDLKTNKIDDTFSKTKRSISRKFRMPRINSHQIIRSIERKSGINFKALGKKLNK